jgi:nucleoside 2-deoxyribosyltransferase
VSSAALSLPVIAEPPKHCEYAGGACDQSFSGIIRSHALLLYPAQPSIISNTIETAQKHLQAMAGSHRWITWRDLGVSGQIIFCQICKAIRFTDLVVADVTTLNFNLLFEIGYCVGLGVPVLPIRDTSYSVDKKAFEELGLLDTLGYVDYQNSEELSQRILDRGTPDNVVKHATTTNRDQPLYVLRAYAQTEGQVRLMSALKKSGLRFRTFDPREVPRLSLHEATKEVFASLAVILPLLSRGRSEATVHNARCAFVAGMAMAAGKHVLMLQEGNEQEPIDYRDVVKSYELPAKVPELMQETKQCERASTVTQLDCCITEPGDQN